MRAALRRWARHAALDGLSALQRLEGARARDLARTRAHLLYLHGLEAAEERSFRTLLSVLARGHAFAGYGEAVDRLRAGALDRPVVAFSFDDGLKSCLRAARLLEEFGARACFFVCPAIVGETRPEAVRAFCRDRLRTPPDEFLSWEDLEGLRAAGHEIGSHTVTHAEAAALSDDALAEELERSKIALERRLGPVRHFAWPFGRFRHAHPRLGEAAARAGYDTCASAERGCHAVRPVPGAPLCLRREHVVAGWPLEHVLYFMARSARRSDAGANEWPARAPL